VQELFQTLVIYVVVIGMVLLGFHLYKTNRLSAEIDTNDQAMAPEYTPGAHKVDSTTPLTQLKTGDAVAYSLPETPDKLRVARIVAVEGELLEFDAKGGVQVGGKAIRQVYNNPAVRPASLRVPRGCVFVLVDAQYSQALDSSRAGPIPLYQIAGKMK
jgi:signal peptidase I